MGKNPRDRDFVMKKKAMDWAKKASIEFNGKCIAFVEKGTFRVALKKGQFIDFSDLKDTINKDLGTRDFTVNAMAWSPEEGLIDPFGGCDDLQAKIIRVVAPENLSSDPLRVLRAYRIAAQLDFAINRRTRALLKENAINLIHTASERITEEIFKVLYNHNAYNYLILCNNDNVLREVLHVSKHNLRQFIKYIKELDLLISHHMKLKPKCHSKVELNKIVGQGLSNKGFLKLFILLGGLTDLKLSGIRLLLSNHFQLRLKRLHNALVLSKGRISEKRLYEIFKVSRGNELETALLVGLEKKGNVDKYIRRAEDFIANRKNMLLKGYDIQKVLHIKPGKIVGEVQNEVERLRFLGTIRNKAEARKWILANFT